MVSAADVSPAAAEALRIYGAESVEQAALYRGIVMACQAKSLEVGDALLLSQLVAGRSAQAVILGEKLLAEESGLGDLAVVALELAGALAALAMVLGDRKP